MYSYASSRWQRVERRPAPTRCQTYASRASARRKALRREGHLSDQLRCSRRGAPKMPASLAAGRLQHGHKALTGGAAAAWDKPNQMGSDEFSLYLAVPMRLGRAHMSDEIAVTKLVRICVWESERLEKTSERRSVRPHTWRHGVPAADPQSVARHRGKVGDPLVPSVRVFCVP